MVLEIPCYACGRKRASSAMMRTRFGRICDDSLKCAKRFYLDTILFENWEQIIGVKGGEEE